MTNLKIYQLVDGVQTPFPNADSQIEIFDYSYNAKRMGGAPSISATVKYATCLDDVWTESVYVEFNGEKYFLKQTPTSSYSNEEARYKHELEMVSERIILDNVYFFDVVSDLEDYKPVTNSTKVVFFGTIKEFVTRLNQSLRYSKLQTGDVLEPQGYKVVIDNGITSESKLITFEDQFFSGVLQEIFNVYELPYYFEGKTIHIGFETQGAVLPTFQYGIDNELLSITKTNANNKIVNRVTGVGSADNIPYYYPNMSEKGNFKAVYYTVDEDGAVNAQNDYVRITSSYRYGKSVETGTGLIYTKETSEASWASEHKTAYSVSATSTIDKPSFKSFNNGNTLYLNFPNVSTAIWITIQRTLHIAKKGRIEIPIEIIQYDNNNQEVNKANSIREVKLYDLENNDSYIEAYVKNNEIIIENAPENNTSYYLQILYNVQYMGYTTSYSGKEYKVKINIKDPEGKSKTYWLDEKTKKTYTKLQDVGLMLNEGVEPAPNDKIIQEKSERYIQPQETLMPPIYREEFGAERFYNAVNGEYKDEDNNDIVFDNPYVDGKPKEQIVEFSDIKPTIKGMTNRQGLRIDMFSEFAYDENDNDEMEEIDGTMVYKHPYFFAKLRKTNGEHAFNLFDSAIDESEMTISMTSGHCGGCNFKVMVSNDDLKQNTVQVYEQDVIDSTGAIIHRAGDLVYDENGNVLCGREDYQSGVKGQERQQNTSLYEVWIALEKDLETYGKMMPSCVVTETNSGNGGFNPELPPIDSPLEKADLMTTGTESETIETVIRPSVDDTFVILHINLPQAYIEYAEERLEKEIIKYMAENNKEKFTFSIKFSRIYLAQNPAIANAINENALLNIMYDGKTYPLYVSSYTYKVDSNTALPEITVELKDEITVNQNAMQKAITEVKGDFLTAFENLDIIGLCGPHFLRKDVDDRSAGKISASMGFEAGSYTKGRSGAKIDEYGQAEFESATVRDKVVVNEISTENYLSGSLGSGAKLWVDENNKANLEIDNLIARESLKVTELIIQKVNSVGGLLVVSAANGEIKEIATNFDDATNGEVKIKSYTVTLNEDAVFENDDIIRCSFWDNEIEDDNKLRTYWVAIKVADSTKKNVITIPATYKNSNNESIVVRPKVGDKIAQMGNTTNTSRQGVIVISTENNKPFISIYDGVNTNSLDASKLRGRFGDLSGITFNGNELNGYGIWSNNAYLNGEFRLSSTNNTIDEEISNKIANDASSRNYARMTATPTNITDISAGTTVTQRIYDVYGFTNGDTLTVSFDWEIHDVVFESNNAFISMQFNDNYGYQTAGFRLEIDSSGTAKGSHTYTLTLQGKWDSSSQTASLPISKSDNGWLYLRFDDITISSGAYIKISNLRVNKGKISHDWEVAPEDANAELDAYKEEVYSQFEVTNGQFTSIQGAISNNTEQGRNILLKTNQGVTNWELSTSLDKNTYYSITKVDYGDAQGVLFSKFDWNVTASYEVFRFPLRPQFIKKEYTYHLSFDARQTLNNIEHGPLTLFIALANMGGGNHLVTPQALPLEQTDGNWHHYDVEFDASASGVTNGDQWVYIGVKRPDTPYWSDIAFANLKLEQSTIATTWSPAPEDAEESIKASEQVLKSEIKQTADAISLKIKETEYFTTSNLIVGSYNKFENKDYLLATYTLADVKPNHGDIVTLSFSGKIEDIQGSFAIYNSGGSVYLARIYASNGFNETTQRYEITFTWLTEREDGVTAPNTDIRIYQGVNAGAVGSFEKPSIIYDVMLTRTDKPVAYKPTPTDVEDKLKDTGIDIESKKITVTADNFQVQNNEGDTTLAVDEKGNLVTNTLQAIGTDGNPLISANVNSSGFLTFYYPNTNQKQMEMGWDAESASLMRYYDDLGNMLWKIGSERGFVAPTSNLIIAEKQYWFIGTLDEIPAKDAYLAVASSSPLGATTVYGQKRSSEIDLLNFYYDIFLSRSISGYLADINYKEAENGNTYRGLRKIENGQMTKTVTVWHGDSAYDIPEDWLN